MQLDEHFLIERARPCFRRKCLINPALASVRVNRFPDRLAGLPIFGQAMPVGARTLVHPLVCGTKDNLVLAPSPMSNFNRAAILHFG